MGKFVYIFLGVLFGGVILILNAVFSRLRGWLLPMLLLAAVILLDPAPAKAEEKRSRRPEKPFKVYVPFDPEKTLPGPDAEKVFIPYRVFIRLWNQAFPERPIVEEVPPSDYHLSRARYEGKLDFERASFQASFHRELEEAS